MARQCIDALFSPYVQEPGLLTRRSLKGVADKSLEWVDMNMKWSSACIAAVAVVGVAIPAVAQVAYQPYAPVAPTPYGYPVPYGFLQPNEELGTSPSYVISNDPYRPTVTVVARCQYPNGWNSTDAVRDFNGTPAGIDHTCPVAVPVRAARLRGRY